MRRGQSRACLGALVIAIAGLACQLPYTGGARPVRPESLGEGWYRATATPVVRQHQETDCGLAALAMVAGAWGRRWSVDDLSRQLSPSPRGVKLGDLRDLARARGLDAYAIRGTTGDLATELSAGRPVVLGLLLPYDRGHNASHYEVAVALRPDDGTVVTIDPASGQWRQRSREVLDLEWKTGGYATLVGLTFTPDVFACGVDIVGPSNIVSLLKTIPPYWGPMLALFEKRVGNLKEDEEFLNTNAEALAGYDNGDRGTSLDEFRKQHPYQRQ